MADRRYDDDACASEFNVVVGIGIV